MSIIVWLLTLPDGAFHTVAKVDRRAVLFAGPSLGVGAATTLGPPSPLDNETVVGSVQLVERISDLSSMKVGPEVSIIRSSGFRIGGLGGADYRRIMEGDTANHSTVVSSRNGVKFALTSREPTPEMFGALADGTSDDSAPFLLALQYATINEYPLFLTGAYFVNDASLSIDVTKTALIGLGQAELRWKNIPTGKTAITLVGEPSYSTRYKQNRVAISAIAIVGGSQDKCLDAVGLSFGDGSQVGGLSHCVVSNVAILGFKTAILYSDYVYFIELDNVGTQWGGIKTPEHSSEFGEMMCMHHCFISDAGGEVVQLSRGEWKIIACSFDNTPVVISNDTVVNFIGCHFENPGSKEIAPKFIISRNSTAVTVRDSFFFINSPDNAKAIADHVIECDDQRPDHRGFLIESCNWNINTSFNPLLGGKKHLSLCGGTGLIRFSNSHVSVLPQKPAYTFGEGAQALANSGFNENFSHWDIEITDRMASAVDLVEDKRGRAARFRVTPRGGQVETTSLSQTVPIGSGEFAVAGAWMSALIGNALMDNGFIATLVFLTINKEVLKVVVLKRVYQVGRELYLSNGDRAPSGSAFISVNFVLRNSVNNGNVIFQLHDILLNIG